jgi:16S rRNA (guanine527-N7)-methyltransferase
MGCEPEAVSDLAAYLTVLARWNRRINLTAFDLDNPSDAAIDRLIIEPMKMARSIIPSDRIAIDVGSGGGSPAIPIKIACPWLSYVLVEVRAKKAAFLREAARELGLTGVQVETCRIEDLLSFREDLAHAADIITIRAVRIDQGVESAMAGLLKPDGRTIRFQ